jgi:hypothetical protein
MSLMGQEERFPPTRLSAGCGFRKETIAGMRRNGRDAPTAAIRQAVGNQPNSALSSPSVKSCSILFVEPDVFEAPAVEQAVYHDCEPLNLRLPARCKTAIKDDRLDIVLGQFPFDVPYQLPAFLGTGFN